MRLVACKGGQAHSEGLQGLLRRHALDCRHNGRQHLRVEALPRGDGGRSLGHPLGGAAAQGSGEGRGQPAQAPGGSGARLLVLEGIARHAQELPTAHGLRGRHAPHALPVAAADNSHHRAALCMAVGCKCADVGCGACQAIGSDMDCIAFDRAWDASLQI